MSEDNKVMQQEIPVASVEENSTVGVESTPETKVENQPTVKSDEGVDIKESSQEETKPKEVTAPETPETPNVNSSLENVPFNENPKFQERLKQIEDKYGEKAMSYDVVMEAAKFDPDFRVSFAEALEKSGQAPAGTADKVREAALKEKSENKTNTKVSSPIPQAEGSEEYKFLQDLYKQAQLQKLEEQKKTLVDAYNFEQKHPEIANMSNVEQFRNIVSSNARYLMSTKNLSWADALESAYKVLVGDTEDIEKAKEKAEVSGQIIEAQKNIVSSANVPTGTPPDKLRKLTPEEENARQLLGGDSKGYTREAYIHLIDDERSGFVG